MVAFTTPDGFIYETKKDQPGTSLRAPDEILAQQVQDKFVTTDAEIAAIKTRLNNLEDGSSMVGWVPIGSGIESSVATFDLDLTGGGKFSIGDFDVVQLFARFDLDAVGVVRMRINNDSGTGSNYRGGGFFTDVTGSVDDSVFADTDNWPIAHGSTTSTCNLTTTLYHMGGVQLHNYQSTSSRQSSNSDVHRTGAFWGALSTGLSAAPSTLRLLTGNGASSFVNFWWWLTGLKMPS